MKSSVELCWSVCTEHASLMTNIKTIDDPHQALQDQLVTGSLILTRRESQSLRSRVRIETLTKKTIWRGCCLLLSFSSRLFWSTRLQFGPRTLPIRRASTIARFVRHCSPRSAERTARPMTTNAKPFAMTR